MEKSYSHGGILPVTDPSRSSGEPVTSRSTFCEKVGEVLNIFWILIAFSLLAFALTIFFCYFTGCQIDLSPEAAQIFQQNIHAPGVRRLNAKDLFKPNQSLTSELSKCQPISENLYQLVCNNQVLCRAALGADFDDVPVREAPTDYAVQFACKDPELPIRVEHIQIVHETHCQCKMISDEGIYRR